LKRLDICSFYMIYNLHFDVRKKLLGKFFSLPFKIQGDSHSLDIAESKYGNQISLSPTNVTEKGLNLKTKFYH